MLKRFQKLLTNYYYYATIILSIEKGKPKNIFQKTIDKQNKICYTNGVKGKVVTEMKDLMYYVDYAYMILKECNIPYSNYITFNTPKQWKSKWGNCHRGYDYVLRRYTYDITLNKILLEETTSEDALMNTLLHEIIHTCDGAFKHTGNFKVYANRVNSKFGYHIKRCTSSEEKGIEEPKPIYKYTIECEYCHRKWNYQKRSKIVTAVLKDGGEEYKCPCGESGGFILKHNI